MGSVFSPTYFAARQRDPQSPATDVCAVNAVLYRGGGSVWAFTEPKSNTVERGRDHFVVSGSRVERDAKGLTIHLDERTAPWGRPIRGRVRLDIEAGAPVPLPLDRKGDHQWWPLGAKAHAEVQLDAPRIRFCGSAYHDCNFGRVPLEDTFAAWSWQRTETRGDVCIIYDVQEHGDDLPRPLSLRIRPDGGTEPLGADVETVLAPGSWGVERRARSQGVGTVLRTLEDTPFYTRSLLQTRFDGRLATTMHESLSLTRFVRPWVQCLLPFRLRRGWRA